MRFRGRHVDFRRVRKEILKTALLARSLPVRPHVTTREMQDRIS